MSAGGLRLTRILRPCTTNGTPSLIVAQHGVVAGACARELSSWFEKDLDGDACHTNSEQSNGQED